MFPRKMRSEIEKTVRLFFFLENTVSPLASFLHRVLLITGDSPLAIASVLRGPSFFFPQLVVLEIVGASRFSAPNGRRDE